MKNIFKILNKHARSAIFILVRLFLGLVYLVLLFPFAVLIRLCTDYLGIKPKPPCWIPLGKVENENEKEFLSHQ